MGPIAHLINDNLVEMLSKRLYPEKLTVLAKTELLSDDKRRQADSYMESCREYEAELNQLSDTALLALAEDEISQDEQRQQELAEEEENNRFFYDRSSRAEFSDWIGRKSWTVDQATALLLGKNPNIVDWSSVNPLVYKSRFAKRYADLRKYLKSAMDTGQIDRSGTPAAFLKFASAIGFVLPADMQILLLAPRTEGSPDDGGTGANAAKPHRGAVSTFRQLIENNRLRPDIYTEAEPEKSATQDVDRKAVQAADLETNKTASPALKSPRDAERIVLLRMLGAMARNCYEFDPQSADLTATRRIVEDFRSAGISANLDSIHKLVCEAVRLNRR